jgi:alkylation response protein AidB-like acyl-CoA dehydrogenase
MDLHMPAECQELAREARAVGRAAAATRAIQEDSWVVGFDREFSRELGRRGWLGMTWPVEAGGHGRTTLERFVVTEALIATGAPLAASWVGDRQIGPTLLAFGTPEQRRRWLPPMVAGEACWSIGMSEPDSGTDLASLRTRAVRDGSGWVLTGRKIWTSFGALAEHCYVIARTDPGAPAHQGLSDFLVDLDSPGVDVRPITDMTGSRHFCEVTFDEVRLPADRLLGAENGSWRQIMGQLEHERGGIDRLVSNRALFEDALERADLRDPIVRQRAARLQSAFHAGRLLVLRGVTGAAPKGHSAVVKVFCTELQRQVTDFVATVDGLGGILAGRTARAVAYAPAYTIQGGTSGILRNVLAERVLGLPR